MIGKKTQGWMMGLTAFFGLGLTACGATSDSASVEVQLRAVNTAGVGLAAPTDDGGDFEVDSAMVNIRDIEFYLPEGTDCDDLDESLDCDEDKIVLEGPFAVDLVDGGVDANVALPMGTYTRIDVRVDDNSDDVAFFAAGRYGEAGTGVEIVLDFNEDIRFEGEVEINGDEDVEGLLMGLDVADWLVGVPIDECVGRSGDSDDPTVIGEDNSGSGSCSDMENAIRDNVEASGSLVAP